jgi:hypothetical protein
MNITLKISGLQTYDFFCIKKGVDMEKLAFLGKNLKKLVKKITKIKFKRW